ncbi:MAG TPA: hypothetical protein VNQ78_06275 [Paracoccus sp. (in: a-proteobacteria)]|uniref:hypothetical protein n=1 Tax=Paracoccus sp. TaxID=267 RepID=UPI002C9A36C1|nr:hypothetical protein [Paracoccus sp. (in: a-proteobacteria)]HWL56269.1 hypothetical protein [Paracoccus sp. (in: a-proteobacteria)]
MAVFLVVQWMRARTVPGGARQDIEISGLASGWRATITIISPGPAQAVAAHLLSQARARPQEHGKVVATRRVFMLPESRVIILEYFQKF